MPHLLTAGIDCIAFVLRGSGYTAQQQSAMLPHDIELMEGPEKLAPSVIWLQRFDDRSFGLGQPLFAFEALNRVNEVNPGSEDRKMRFCVLRHAVACVQCACEDIEAAAKSVDVSASLDMERERQRLFFGHYHQIIRDIRIRVFDDHFEVELEPGVDLRLKGWELGYGPVNACLSV